MGPRPPRPPGWARCLPPLLLLLLLAPVRGEWDTAGRSFYRTNDFSAQLPTGETGAGVVSAFNATPGSPVLAPNGPPLLFESAPGGPEMAVVPVGNCSVSFLGTDLTVTSVWAGCRPGEVRVAPLLIAHPSTSSSIFRGLVARLNPWAGGAPTPQPPPVVLIATTYNNSGWLWGVSCQGATHRVLWGGPLKLPRAALATDFVVVGNTVAMILEVESDDPYSFLLLIILPEHDHGTPTLKQISVPPCGAWGGGGRVRDTPSLYVNLAPSVLNTGDTQLLLILSPAGCLHALQMSTFEWIWNTQVPGGPEGSFVSTPAADPTNGNVFTLSSDGWFCHTATYNLLRPVNTTCHAARQAAPFTLGNGVAVSPMTPEFHEGRAYAVDSLGSLWALDPVSGKVVGQSGNLALAGNVSTPPLLVLHGFGSGWNALLALSADGVLGAYSVGVVDSVDASDDADDDSDGTSGVVWSLDVGCNVTAEGFSIRADGLILIPCSDGGVVGVGPLHTLPVEDSGSFVITLVLACVALALVGVGATLWAAVVGRGGEAGGLLARWRLRNEFLLELRRAKDAAKEDLAVSSEEAGFPLLQGERGV